jgi:hypothetical protein
MTALRAPGIMRTAPGPFVGCKLSLSSTTDHFDTLPILVRLGTFLRMSLDLELADPKACQSTLRGTRPIVNALYQTVKSDS